MRAAWIWTSLLGLGLAACSPTYNWREVRPESAPLRVMLPCRPDAAERLLPLLGPQADPVNVRMLSCVAGRHTFAFAFVRLPDSASTAQALRDWKRAAWASLQQGAASGAAGGPEPAPPGWVQMPRAVAGATLVEYWRGPGLTHDGRGLQANIALAARGPWLVQAAAYGPGLDDEASATFFEGVRFE